MPVSAPFRKALSKEDKEDLERARCMQAMIATEGWKHFCNIVNASIKDKTAEAMLPCKSLDDVYFKEALKGSVLSLRLTLLIPQSMIDTAVQIMSGREGEEE